MQEAITNIVRYAQAQCVTVELLKPDDQLYVRIRDDGIGFDPTERSKGIGLQNISNRVEFYSGKVDLNSAPGKGCNLKVSIPC